MNKKYTREDFGKDGKTVYFELLEGPDRHGKYSFFIHWWSENFHLGPSVRGQIFVCDALAKQKEYEQKGLKVMVVDNRINTR